MYCNTQAYQVSGGINIGHNFPNSAFQHSPAGSSGVQIRTYSQAFHVLCFVYMIRHTDYTAPLQPGKLQRPGL